MTSAVRARFFFVSVSDVKWVGVQSVTTFQNLDGWMKLHSKLGNELWNSSLLKQLC